MSKMAISNNGQKLPFVKKDQVILSEGVWKRNKYSLEEIRNAYLNTDWNDKERRHLYNDHLDVDPNDPMKSHTPVSSWVGFVENPRFTDKGLVGDIEVWDPTIAFYLDKAKPKFGISATMQGHQDKNLGEFRNFMFNSFGLVVNPGCKDAYMSLSDDNNEEIEKVRMLTLVDEKKDENLHNIERGSNLVKNKMAKNELETTESVENAEEDKKETETTETVENTEEKSEEVENKEDVKEETVKAEPETKPEEKVEEKSETKPDEKVEEKADDEKEDEKETEAKKLSEKTISELTVKELSDYSEFAVKYLADNPDTSMKEVADAFEASNDKEETLSGMTNQEMFDKITEMQSVLASRMGKTLSDDKPEIEKVEEKSEEKNDEPVEESKVLSDDKDVQIQKLSDEVAILQKKLSEPATRMTLSDTNGAICAHTHEDAFQSMAAFISSGGQGSYTL